MKSSLNFFLFRPINSFLILVLNERELCSEGFVDWRKLENIFSVKQEITRRAQHNSTTGVKKERSKTGNKTPPFFHGL